MTSDWERALNRARDDLGAANHLRASGHAPQACSRAYFAAFYAASAALSLLGETRTKHSGVLSAFHDKVIRDGGFDTETGRMLGWLFDLRNTADYRWDPVAASDAEEAFERASRFVGAVEQWIRSRDEGADS
ncbi:MAG: HEPN domain-containing protein [Actinomycetota bacterium]